MGGSCPNCGNSCTVVDTDGDYRAATCYACKHVEEEGERPEECSYCEKYKGEMCPPHNGSSYCESGSIASGGTRSHCTCDWCF